MSNELWFRLKIVSSRADFLSQIKEKLNPELTIKNNNLSQIEIQKRIAIVVACSCNPATLEENFQNSVGSMPVGGGSP